MTLDRVRQSLRTLKRQKRFAATAIACLGVAIALNTTMYSVLDGLISPRSEIRNPEQLHDVQWFGDYRQTIPTHERDAALRSASFQDGIAITYWPRAEDRLIEHGSQLREAIVSVVSPNYFAVLGLRPLAGRLLDSRDSAAHVPAVVLGERMWKQLFPDVKEFQPADVLLGGESRHVVGIISKGAGFPYVDVWLLPNAEQLRNGGWTPRVVRRKAAVTAAQAASELALISQRFRVATGEGSEAGWRFRMLERPSYSEWNFRYALIGSVFAVLLIACANLANLQLARGVSRARELATRAAVGATRGDIIWQLLLESGWLALGGLALGSVLTVWGIWLIDHYVPREVAQYMSYPQVSWRVVAFAVSVTLLSLGLVGLLPAVRLSRVDINELLKSGAGTGKARSARRQYGALVVVEVSLALALLCSTGLMVRSAMTVRAYDYRNDYSGLVYGGAMIRPDSGNARARRVWSDILVQQALKTDSVVRAATATSGRPSKRAITAYGRDGQPFSLSAHQWDYSLVSADYFRTTGMPIIRGRNFAPGEFAGHLAIIDSLAAKSLWPGQDPIGKQLKLDSAYVNAPWVTVIGVVTTYRRQFIGSDREAWLAEQVRQFQDRGDRFVGQVWVLNSLDTVTVASTSPRNRWRAGAYISLVVRARGDSKRLPLELRNKLAELGPSVLPSYPRTWEETSRIGQLRAKHDFMATLFSVFALFALSLAALGVYAIIAHMVAQRTREFGVRIAVGAGERDIRQMVLQEGNVLTLSGIAVGLLITYKTAGWVRAFVFSDWDRFDSRVFAVVALLLFAAAWLASYLPARRAMRINPVEALRSE
jgi:putative ABC transport system permease protein